MELEELKKKLEECEQQRDEYLNGWKRAKADFLNYQKDEAKRMDEVVKFSSEMLVRELLPVLDSFQISLSMMAGPARESEGARRGVEIIQAQFEEVLKRHGLEPIAAVGEQFDPGIHEAIEEAEAGQKPGTIIEELTRGWKLNGKVIRPARVKVSK